LHVSQFSNANPKKVEVQSGITNANINTDSKSDDGLVYMPVVTVNVNGHYKVNAFLDNGSSSSFCSSDLVQALGLEGQSIHYCLSTMSKSGEPVSSQVVNFDVCSLNGSESLSLRNVIVVDRIPVRPPGGRIPQYRHLKNLPIACNGEAVQILIGQDNSEALVPLEVRKGKPGEPFASGTLLGWTLNGPARVFSLRRSVLSNFVSVDAGICQDINVLWNVENEGLCSDAQSWSVEDRKVVDLWDRQCELVGSHYQLPIPFKNDAEFPNNYVMASSRLQSTKKSLIKRGLYAKYDEEIMKLVSKGYAEKVPSDVVDSSSRVWFLPHQVVLSDKKPGKLRIVFDCAAKFHGESLNDKCLQGPNLCNKVLDVLNRFRQYPFTVVADIEAMYYQVLVPPDERDVLRFLWFDGSDVVQYRMTRHVFGGIWCASASAYAMRRVLVDNPGVDPIVEDTIQRSFYVDDCLRSAQSPDQVKTIVEGVAGVLKKGGFKLTKFVMN
jgi:hypothetical protein